MIDDLTATIHNAGYSAVITAKDAELYAHALNPSGTSTSSMPIGTGDVKEVYEKLADTLKSKNVPHHLICDLCKYDKDKNMLFFDGKEVEVVDLINIVEKLQFEALKKQNA